MKFSDISGLDEIKQVLIHSVKNNHIAHAQLFLGNEGEANLALALAYATYINCTNKQNDDACGQCPSCQKFDKLIHPDLHFVIPTALKKGISKRSDAVSTKFLPEWREFLLESPYRRLFDWTSFFGAENKQANIPKEESRNIITTLALKSFEAEYKVMLIWLPELMQAPAANAILKILEEPPAKTLFLLVSNDANKLLTTILSRTQIVKVRSFHHEEITQYLSQNKNLESSKADEIAYLANGNMAEALHISENSGNESSDFFQNWMRACFKADFSDIVLNWNEKFNKMGKEAQKNLFIYGINILRESMIWKYTGEQLSKVQEDQKGFITNFSKVLHENNLPKLTQYFNDACYYIERNANPKITFLFLSIQVMKTFRQQA